MKTEFSIGTNFDKTFIDQISSYNVYEVYGKMTTDFVGGCRPPIALADISKGRLAEEVNKVHKNGMLFNYLLNSSCLGNKEFSTTGHKKLVSLLNYLKDIKVDTVTVTIPYLAEYIKKNFDFKISVSTLAGVDNLKKVRLWQDIGADEITLSLFANRNFDFLRKLSELNGCVIKLMVNQACELDCLSYNYHTNINSHQSQSKCSLPIEYCTFNCKNRRTKDRSLLIKSPWIRPEDIKYYNDLGFYKFKIVQRQDPTEKLLKALDAYSKGFYDGNLLDIMNFVYNLKKMSFWNLDFSRKVKYFKSFFKPKSVKMLKFLNLVSKIDDDFDLYIDNKQLAGFIEGFPVKCYSLACDSCGYCTAWANKVITFDEKKLEKILDKQAEIVDMFVGLKNNIFI